MGWARAEARRVFSVRKLLAWVAFSCPWCGWSSSAWDGALLGGGSAPGGGFRSPWMQGTWRRASVLQDWALWKGSVMGLGPPRSSRRGVVFTHVLLVARRPNRAPPWPPCGMRSQAASPHKPVCPRCPSVFKLPLNGCSWPFGFSQRLLSLITLSLRGEAGVGVELSTAAEIPAP